MSIKEYRPSRKILSFAAYLLFALGVAFFIIDRHPEKLKLGTRAPIETSLTSLMGNKLNFKKLIKKVTVINFFATWCPPCIKEMPTLSRLSKKYQEEVDFIGAAINSNIRDVAQIKKEFALNYEIGMIDAATVSKWQAEAIPLTYIVDKNGMVLWAYAGVLEGPELEKVLESALRN